MLIITATATTGAAAAANGISPLVFGFVGLSGSTGCSGLAGSSGLAGFSGFSGSSGFAGLAGSSGFSGLSGSSGFSESFFTVTTNSDISLISLPFSSLVTLTVKFSSLTAVYPSGISASASCSP